MGKISPWPITASLATLLRGTGVRPKTWSSDYVNEMKNCMKYAYCEDHVRDVAWLFDN